MLQPPPRPGVLLWRAFRLSCPACGRGRLFRRYFLRTECCTGCGRRFEREEGYWVGGSEVHMFASYGLSVLVCIPCVILLEPTALLYAGVLAGHVALSLLVFRYSRAIFLAIDYGLDPRPRAGEGDDPGTEAVDVRPPTPPTASRRVRREAPSRLRLREPAGV